MPGDNDAKEYNVHKSTEVVIDQSLTKEKALHWTGAVAGQLALDMAANIDSMFGRPAVQQVKKQPKRVRDAAPKREAGNKKVGWT